MAGTHKDIVRVGLTQMACSDNVQDNLQRQIALLEQAARDGARVLCTQELFLTQYFCQTEDHHFFELAESIPGPTTAALAEVARRHQAVIIASVFERRARGLFHNTAVVIESDGSIAGLYRKMHIPDDPLFYEKFYFTPSDTGFRCFQTSQGPIGALICWDQWYPEAARATALAGAEMVFYPTAIGWHPSEKQEFGERQRESWELMMRSHALANGCFVCAANRIGHELLPGPDAKPVNPGGIEFWGSSFIAGPDGRIIAKASADREQTLIADLDLSQIETSRTHWPFLRDRRIDAYAPLLNRFNNP